MSVSCCPGRAASVVAARFLVWGYLVRVGNAQQRFWLLEVGLRFIGFSLCRLDGRFAGLIVQPMLAAGLERWIGAQKRT